MIKRTSLNISLIKGLFLYEMTIVFLVMKIEIVHNVEAFCAFFVFVLELFPLCKHNFPSIIFIG